MCKLRQALAQATASRARVKPRARPAISFLAVLASNHRSGGSIAAQNARLHRRSGAGRLQPPDETPARNAAPVDDPGSGPGQALRPWQRDGLPPGTGPPPEDRHLVLRPARPVAARLERKHQWFAAPVLPQGHRPERSQSDRTHRRGPPDEPATPQNPRVENPRGSHGRGTRGLQINRCT